MSLQGKENNLYDRRSRNVQNGHPREFNPRDGRNDPHNYKPDSGGRPYASLNRYDNPQCDERRRNHQDNNVRGYSQKENRNGDGRNYKPEYGNRTQGDFHKTDDNGHNDGRNRNPYDDKSREYLTRDNKNNDERFYRSENGNRSKDSFNRSPNRFNGKNSDRDRESKHLNSRHDTHEHNAFNKSLCNGDREMKRDDGNKRRDIRRDDRVNERRRPLRNDQLRIPVYRTNDSPIITKKPKPTLSGLGVKGQLQLKFGNKIGEIKRKLTDGGPVQSNRPINPKVFKNYQQNDIYEHPYQSWIKPNKPRSLRDLKPFVEDSEYKTCLVPEFPKPQEPFETYCVTVPEPKKSKKNAEEDNFDDLWQSFIKMTEETSLKKSTLEVIPDDFTCVSPLKKISNKANPLIEINEHEHKFVKFCNSGYIAAISDKKSEKDIGFLQLVEATLIKAEILNTYMNSNESFKSKYEMIKQTSDYLDGLQKSLELNNPSNIVISVLELLRGGICLSALNFLAENNYYGHSYYKHVIEMIDMFNWKGNNAISYFLNNLSVIKIQDEFPKTYNSINNAENPLCLPPMDFKLVTLQPIIDLARAFVDETIEKLGIKEFGRSPLTTF